MQHIKEIYGDQIKLQFSIVLEREKVNLMFSKEAKNGWKIRPMFNPVVSDSFYVHVFMVVLVYMYDIVLYASLISLVLLLLLL